MRSARTFVAVGAATLGALSLVACGSDRGVVTAPSTVHAAVAPDSVVVTTTNQIRPSGAVNTTTPITVTSLVAGTSCPTLQFMVYTYLFKVDGATQYEGGACANIQPGSKINFSGSRDSESSPVFTVARLSFATGSTPAPTPTPSPAPPPPTTPASTEVTVSSLVSGTSCPSLSFMVGTYKISVSTATLFEHGACTDIAAGKKLGLTGTRQGDGVINASKIEFRDTTSPNPTGRPVNGEGTISSVSGTTACPTLQFFIGSYLIKLDGSTQYVGGSCADLKPGLKVGVAGSMGSDGSVAATAITVKNDTPQPEQQAEGEGVVTALVGGSSCPALQFTIGEYTITLTASTQFSGGSCVDVAAGRKVGVRGTMTGAKSATASLITFKE